MHYMNTNQRDLTDSDKIRTGCDKEECSDKVCVDEEAVTCPKCKKYLKDRYSFSFYR